jgi:hypothetical protein
MLGHFLEYSAAAQPLAASFEFFGALGFTSLPVGDLLSHPYAVLFDGALAVGLHDREQDGPQLTFVRPDLRDYVRPLRRLGIEFSHERLRESEFNSVGFSDPGGQPIALIEARTFPPGEHRPHNVAICGALVELSLPAADLRESTRFWGALGLLPVAAGEIPHRWQRLRGRGVTLGLHETHCRPGLSFRCTGLDARVEYLRAKGLAPRAGNPLADPGQPAATLTAPDGTVLYLLESGAQ